MEDRPGEMLRHFPCVEADAVLIVDLVIKKIAHRPDIARETQRVRNMRAQEKARPSRNLGNSSATSESRLTSSPSDSGILAGLELHAQRRVAGHQRVAVGLEAGQRDEHRAIRQRRSSVTAREGILAKGAILYKLGYAAASDRRRS